MAAVYDCVEYEVHEHIGILLFRRPDKLNAMNAQLWLEFEQVLDRVEADDHVRVLLISGKGRAFSAGADLKESGTRTGEEYRNYLTKLQLISKRLIDFPKPTIAAINGFALGSGFEIALACDLRFAAMDAMIGAPEAKVTASVTGGGFKLLYDLVGPGYAKEILFTAIHVSGERAAEIGLVNKAVPGSELMETAKSFANTLSENSALSIRLMKQGLARVGSGESMDALLEYEVEACMEAVTSEERKEKLDAFANRKSS